jgi:hypothetical protein
VIATSGRNAWAVGGRFPPSVQEPVRALLLRWNDGNWTMK